MTDIANLHLRVNTREVKQASDSLVDLDKTGKQAGQTIKDLAKTFAGFIATTSLASLIKGSGLAQARYREFELLYKRKERLQAIQHFN